MSTFIGLRINKESKPKVESKNKGESKPKVESKNKGESKPNVESKE